MFVVLALLLLALIGCVIYADSVAKALVERGTTAALGVESSTESVNVSLWRRSVGINRLTVANPEGYQKPLLFEANRVDVDVELNTLFADVIEVPRVLIDGVTLHLEQRNGRNNVAVIMEHLQERRTEDQPQRFRVDQVVIRNLEARLTLLEQLGELSEVTVEIPEIVLDDVATEEGRGVAVAEITRRIVPAIVAAVLEEGEQLPNNVTTMLTGNLAELAEQAGGDVARLIGAVGGDVGEAIERAVGDFTGRLNDLLNGRGNDEEPDNP